MTLWRMLRGMFFWRREAPPPRDPAVAQATKESRDAVHEARQLTAQLRLATERRRLANARRRYEERQYGSGRH